MDSPAEGVDPKGAPGQPGGGVESLADPGPLVHPQPPLAGAAALAVGHHEEPAPSKPPEGLQENVNPATRNHGCKQQEGIQPPAPLPGPAPLLARSKSA